jgi:hypothetical protein
MIKDTLKNAISLLSKKHNVNVVELRIKISKPENSLVYDIMKNKEVLEQTNIATALNLNSIVAFMVANRLSSIIDGLVVEHGIEESKINVRIYTKTEDCEPLIYLFDGKEPKCQLDIEKFI